MLIGPDLKVNNFDLLRCLLAVTVIFSHWFVIYYGKGIDTEPFMIFSRNQIDLGSVAVNGFFIISGFLIIHSYKHSSSFWAYLKKRVLRIYPGFFVAFIISMLLLGPLGTFDVDHPQGNLLLYFHSIRKKLFLLNLFTMQAPFAIRCFMTSPLPNQINESLWTIQYEFICYLAVPLFAYVGIFKKRWVALALFALAYLVLALQDFARIFLWESYQGKIISHPLYMPRFFAFFLAGACFYLFREKIARSFGLVALSILGLVISCVWFKGFNLVAPFALTYLIFYLAYFPRFNFPRFTKHGDFSYGIYLYAWPVQQLFMLFIGRELSLFSLFLLSLATTVLAAYASWRFVEKPFLQLKDRPGFLSFIPWQRLQVIGAKK
ncbi:acyltransferase family protein [Rufibacter roseolus]|uniref:acyltransferase family protein n=1 Tax=Rufibacter roseolus TaxID=2817375 RepID=UPI001FEF6B42|nr:acyltransferase [Rufibacter roseolus]